MKTSLLVLITIFGCLTTGCVTHTTYYDQPRASVRFQSAGAAQTFYDAYLASGDPKGNGVVSFAVQLPYSHRTIFKDTVRFNSVVRTTDANHDGVISMEEAQAFAAQCRTSKAELPASPR